MEQEYRPQNPALLEERDLMHQQMNRLEQESWSQGVPYPPEFYYRNTQRRIIDREVVIGNITTTSDIEQNLMRSLAEERDNSNEEAKQAIDAIRWGFIVYAAPHSPELLEWGNLYATVRDYNQMQQGEQRVEEVVLNSEQSQTLAWMLDRVAIPHDLQETETRISLLPLEQQLQEASERDAIEHPPLTLRIWGDDAYEDDEYETVDVTPEGEPETISQPSIEQAALYPELETVQPERINKQNTSELFVDIRISPVIERLTNPITDIDLATTLEKVSYLPLPQVAEVVNVFAHADNPSQGFYAFAAVNTIHSALQRRAEPGIPLLLTETENEAMQNAFDALQEIVPKIRAATYGREFFLSHLRDLRDAYPEMEPLTQSLLHAIGRTEAEEAIARLSEVSPTTSIGEMQAFLQRHSIRELLEMMNRYSALNKAMGKLTEPQQTELLGTFGMEPDDTNLTKRLFLLNNIFSNINSNHAIRALDEHNISLEQLPALLNNEAIFKLIDFMLDNPKHYRFQLGIIFSEITLNNIPETLKTKMKPFARDMEFSLQSDHNDWYLCGEAEPRLLKSIRDKTTILVNDTILMKTVGKFSGLALETFTTQEGKVFHEGNWYSPTDNDSRKAIRKAFDEGQARITLDKGTWTFMRPVSHDYDTKSPAAEDVLNQAKSYVASMPNSLPEDIWGETRQEYRRHYYDEG